MCYIITKRQWQSYRGFESYQKKSITKCIQVLHFDKNIKTEGAECTEVLHYDKKTITEVTEVFQYDKDTITLYISVP